MRWLRKKCFHTTQSHHNDTNYMRVRFSIHIYKMALLFSFSGVWDSATVFLPFYFTLTAHWSISWLLFDALNIVCACVRCGFCGADNWFNTVVYTKLNLGGISHISHRVLYSLWVSISQIRPMLRLDPIWRLASLSCGFHRHHT